MSPRPTPWFFRVTLPAIWLAATLSSWRHPGADHILFLVSCLPGLWVKLFIASSSLADVEPFLIAGGIPFIGLSGWVMDALRARRLLWLYVLAFSSAAWAWLMLAAYPTYGIAIAKNGSIATYLSAATNLGLYGSVVLCVGMALVAGGSRE